MAPVRLAPLCTAGRALASLTVRVAGFSVVYQAKEADGRLSQVSLVPRVQAGGGAYDRGLGQGRLLASARIHQVARDVRSVRWIYIYIYIYLIRFLVQAWTNIQTGPLFLLFILNRGFAHVSPIANNSARSLTASKCQRLQLVYTHSSLFVHKHAIS